MQLRVIISFLIVFSVFFSLINAKNYISNATINKIQRKYGTKASLRAKALNRLMTSLVKSSDREKITKVNSFFNQMTFASDIKLWGQRDYWQTRVEFLGKGAGDCEDYVIAKYFTLKQLGVSTKKLYFTYVKALRLRQAHMVLTYYKTPNSIPLVLDSINPKILPATSRKDLAPVYSFNGDALFLAKQTGLGQVVPSGNSRNKKWLRLIDRMKREGL